MNHRMRTASLVAVLATLGCAAPRDAAVLGRATIADTVASAYAGPAARGLARRPGFAWLVTESAHALLHAPRGSRVATLATGLADSVEAARFAALALLGEPERADEPRLQLFFVDTREDMQRLMGRPIGGFAQPGELTAAFVAGPGYRPFLRHELTHAYAYVRWGELRAGDWLSEGLAALAQGPCQGHTIDALAAGYLADGRIPPLTELARDFRSVPELPGYMAAASATDYVRRRRGILAIRELWRGAAQGASAHPLGAAGAELEKQWQAALRALPPARLDSARLRRDGC